jgi:protoheme IX farnesyltransferase
MNSPSPTVVMTAEPLSPSAGMVATTAADLSRLVRPRIAVMVLATVATAAWLTAGRSLSGAGLALVLLGTLLVAASSSIANQILERHTDRLMPRTATRPLVTGRLGVREAWILTVILLVVGLAITVAGGGWAASVASLATWLLYVVVYTPLKRVTPLNTAVGAIAGALPVAIGWFAAGGPGRFSAGDTAGGIAAGALATVLYLWQFPHFMAIAWLYRRQYSDAGLRMLTVVDPGGLRAAGQALAAALSMVPVSLLLAVPSGSEWMFLVAAIASVAYVAATMRFAVSRDDASARGLLLVSLGSLLSILVAAVTCGGPPS